MCSFIVMKMSREIQIHPHFSKNREIRLKNILGSGTRLQVIIGLGTEHRIMREYNNMIIIFEFLETLHPFDRSYINLLFVTINNILRYIIEEENFAYFHQVEIIVELRPFWRQESLSEELCRVQMVNIVMVTS